MKIDQPRYAEWVRLSHRLNPFEAFMIVAVQGLGKLDAQLIAQDRDFLQSRNSKQDDFEASLELTDRFTYSYLWVLGAYEIVRSIDQRCREDRASFVTDELAEAVRRVKVIFERVRVPLAKFEPARKFAATDSTVAFPAIDSEHGVAWHIAQDTIVSRQSLSQEFMELLRLIPSQAAAA